MAEVELRRGLNHEGCLRLLPTMTRGLHPDLVGVARYEYIPQTGNAWLGNRWKPGNPRRANMICYRPRHALSVFTMKRRWLFRADDIRFRIGCLVAGLAGFIAGIRFRPEL